MRFKKSTKKLCSKKKKSVQSEGTEKGKMRKQQAVCILSGIFLFAAYPLIQKNAGFLESGGVIERNSYGQGVREGTVLVDGLSKESEKLELAIEERKYSREEAEKNFDQALEKAKKEILGENSSLSEVRSSLKLSSWLDSMGMGMKWESENPDLIDSGGEINTDKLMEEWEKGEGKEDIRVILSLTLSAGEYKKQYEIPIILVPPYESKEERDRVLLERKIEELNREQNQERSLTLPSEFQGKKLSYKNEPDYDRYLFPALGIAAAGLLELRKISEEKEKKNRRERELALDYSDIVSGLCAYLCAGFPVRRAWEQLADEYEENLNQPGGRRRAGYEEVKISSERMKQGVPELKAYAEFGQSCGLRSYRKLSGLMSQYVRNGSGSLRKSLEEEMEAAFEERKTAARKIGEETGTKLLIPLFIMLMIVMVMVSVPAFLSFGL